MTRWRGHAGDDAVTRTGTSRLALVGSVVPILLLVLMWPGIVALAAVTHPAALVLCAFVVFCLAFILGRRAFRGERRSALRVSVVALAIGWMGVWLFALHNLPTQLYRARQRHWNSLAAPLPELGARVYLSGSEESGEWSVASIDTTVDDTRLRQWVPHLARLKTRDLNLQGTRITACGVESLKSVRSLEYLCLANTSISDDALEYLAALESLNTLNLEGTRVTDSGLTHLTRLKQLIHLNIRRTSVTAAGILSFRRQSPRVFVEWDTIVPDRVAPGHGAGTLRR